jgi:hypothetical protein
LRCTPELVNQRARGLDTGRRLIPELPKPFLDLVKDSLVDLSDVGGMA